MKHQIGHAIAGVLVAWSVGLGVCEAEPAVGQPAPDFSLVGRLYGAKTTPHMFVINPEGVLIYAGAIDNRPSADPADVAGATNYVHLALDEAMAGKPVSTPQSKSYGCSVKY